MTALLEVSDLSVCFTLRGQPLKALDGISFKLDKGQRLGIVGESGAGKSVVAFSILNLISRPGHISSGKIIFEGKDLVQCPENRLRFIRGNRIAMIFQDPMMTLNPVLTIGTQMTEVLKAHQKINNEQARQRAIECLRMVHIPSPEQRFSQYPHELSGGMRQRIVIAIALMGNPSLIIADEPTTALDVTIQAEIMGLLLELCINNSVGLILITHDLGVVSQITERTIVMYAGRIVEEADTRHLIDQPRHPYTIGLINALPERTAAGQRLNQIPGVMPSLRQTPDGCAFHPRCELIEPICQQQAPKLLAHNQRRIACHIRQRCNT